MGGWCRVLVEQSVVLGRWVRSVVICGAAREGVCLTFQQTYVPRLRSPLGAS